MSENTDLFRDGFGAELDLNLTFGTRQIAAGLNHINVYGIDQDPWTQSHVPLINPGPLYEQAQPYQPLNLALNPGIDQGGNTIPQSSSIAFPGNLPTELSQAWSNGNSGASTSHFVTELEEGTVNAAATLDGAAVTNDWSYSIGLLGSGDAAQEGQFMTTPIHGNLPSLNGNDPGFGFDASLSMLMPLPMGMADQFTSLSISGGFQSVNGNDPGFGLYFNHPVSVPPTMDTIGQGQTAFLNEAATTATVATGRAFDDGPGLSMPMPPMPMPSMPMAPTALSNAQQDAVFPQFTGTGNPTTASLTTSISAPMPIPMASTSVRGVRAAAPRVQCTRPGCTKTFQRDADRIRHQNTTHRNNYGQYRCPIVGCRKSRDRGFSRPDKVTEHLWKMHADLGYAKKA